MKRFHAHVAVTDLPASIDFYSKLFGQTPTRQEPDYAKWMLEDPRVNFAISSRGHAAGLNHFGMQADSAEELAALRQLANDAADGKVLGEGAASCCYAKSEKHWTLDPQGLAWEHFHTMSDAVAFGEDNKIEAGACCIPLRGSEQDSSAAACCIPNETSKAEGGCCS